MKEFFLIAGAVLVLALCIVIINFLMRKEAEHWKEIERLQEALKKAEVRINVQTELLNKMETGSTSGDLAACNDILHELSKK